jgi:hypothetical protein
MSPRRGCVSGTLALSPRRGCLSGTLALSPRRGCLSGTLASCHLDGGGEKGWRLQEDIKTHLRLVDQIMELMTKILMCRSEKVQSLQ